MTSQPTRSTREQSPTRETPIPVHYTERRESIPVAKAAPRPVPAPRYRVVVSGGRRLRVRVAAA